ncbi:hypothetical protein GF391_02525 [Candidatus Uhrbacteria bacterium]|nr:hypothetical protein [Candidatus Uhrbacteria bacterium]
MNELEDLKQKLEDARQLIDANNHASDEELARLRAEVKQLKVASTAATTNADNSAREKKLEADLAAAQAHYAQLEQSAESERLRLEAQLQAATTGGDVGATELQRLEGEKQGLQTELGELRRAYNADQVLLKKVRTLDPEPTGAPEKLALRLQTRIVDLQNRIATLQTSVANADSQGRAQNALDQIQQERDGFEAQVAQLNHELEQAQEKVRNLEQNNPQIVEFNRKCGRIMANARDEVAKLDPNLSDEDRDKAAKEINDKARRAIQDLRAKLNRKPLSFSGTFVLIGALILLVISVGGGYLIGARTSKPGDATKPVTSTGASAPAPVASASAPEAAGSAQEPVQPEPDAQTEPKASAPVLPEYEEKCYPVSAKVMALHHGRRLKNGKIFGQLRDVPEGYHRIVCDGSREPDETGWTDVSNCKSCGPKPGSYPVAEYLEVFTGQSDPTCYTSPSNFSFHRWSKNSLHFDCGGKTQPYDAMRECSDMSGCKLVLPDPEETACEVCGD